MNGQAKLIVINDGESTEPKILAEFLTLFEACVVAAADLNVEWNSTNAFSPEVQEAFQQISPLKWNAYFDQRSGDLISIQSIRKNSPLEIALACSITLVALAVILSGGKIKVTSGGLEATLPSLGESIASLKKSLGLGGKITSSYSIRTIKIKLNSEEVEALLKQDPAQKGKGGFQNFLVGLQTRLNRTTHELTLSDIDLERIMRYKADPKKGGFQSRFKKIFGRHFE